LYKLRNGKTHPVLQKIQAIHRINYAGTFIKQDFDKFNSTYNFNLKWLWYCYYNIEDTVKNNSNAQFIVKEDILIGNSANPSNNHIDAFHVLKSFHIGNRKVFCPLSYGADSKEYANRIIEEGKKIFGTNFIPLKEFLTIDEYNGILNSCNIVIMNQNRQQAVGNIISSIWHGSKVFLNEENPVYKYFLEIGVKIFSIQNDLSIKNQFNFSSLDQNIIAANRAALIKNLSKEAVLDKTYQMIKGLTH